MRAMFLRSEGFGSAKVAIGSLMSFGATFILNQTGVLRRARDRLRESYNRQQTLLKARCRVGLGSRGSIETQSEDGIDRLGCNRS